MYRLYYTKSPSLPPSLSFSLPSPVLYILKSVPLPPPIENNIEASRPQSRPPPPTRPGPPPARPGPPPRPK